MNLAEATKNMIDVKPLTKKQILDDLSLSRQQIEDGEYDDFDEALDRIGAEYGI